MIDNKLSITLAVAPVVNYSQHCNGVKIVQNISITNNSDKDLKDLRLKLETSPAFGTTKTTDINFIPAGKSYEIKTVDLNLDLDYLAGMTERVEGEVIVSLLSDEVLATANEKISILAFDQWSGTSTHPELLASFVTPNHPVLAKLISKGSTYLNKWCGDSSFTGDLREDPDKVLEQAAALFNAIKDENLIYSICPASFETTGQRIRLCDMVLQQKMGTCMDLTLLYASCLEAVGLHPLLIMTENHIFTGVWLGNLTFPDSVSDDPSIVTKRLADGINEIAVIETTMGVNGNNASFNDAVNSAECHFHGEKEIEYIVDVRRARLCGIIPIPQRVHDSEGWHIEHDLPKKQGGTTAPDKVSEIIDVSEEVFDYESIPKMVQWERKLLDLGLRNNLISLRRSKNLVPLLSTSLDELEDSLSQGEDFEILSRSAEGFATPEFDFENMHDPGEYRNLVVSEFKNKRLRTVFSESELNKTMKTLYRSAKTAMEENGANTLYLVLGLLRWFESSHSNKPRYAPVILLPVDLVRRAGNKGYKLRLRDEDPQMNITILEKIKQDFGVNISGLDPLPCDESGIDLRRVFTVLRKATMGLDRWDVLESAYIGIFSFSQFVMWSDLRHRADTLAQNKIVRSLIEGKLAWEAKPMIIGNEVKEDGTLLPMPADASQLFAIQAACNGESFVLHGPPGTGKSQTITSLIANALAKGKSVLFVAEKKAALDVVQKRLEDIGISPFCLELHSNKTKKRAVLDQLRVVTEIARRKTPEQYLEKAERLKESRESLDSYAEQLHRQLPCGYSIFRLINKYEEFYGAPDLIVFNGESVQDVDISRMETNAVLLERMVAVAKAAGHPHQHPLSSVGVRQYSKRLRYELDSVVKAYRELIIDFVPCAKLLSEMLSFGPIGNDEKLETLAKLAESIVDFQKYPKSWLNVENPTEYFADIKKMATHFHAYQQRKEYLLRNWDEAFLSEDGEALIKEYCSINSQWFIGRKFGQKRFAQQLLDFAKSEDVDIEEDVQILYRMQQEFSKGEAMLQNYIDDMGALYEGENTDWSVIAKYADSVVANLTELQRLIPMEVDRLAVCTDANIVMASTDFTEKFPTFNKQKNIFFELLQINTVENDLWLEEQEKLCDNILANKDQLKDWIAFIAIADEVRGFGLGELVDAYYSGAKHEEILPAYKKAIYKALIISAIDQDDVLNSFSGCVFDEKIEQYKRLDKEFTGLVRKELFCRLAANIPDFTSEAAQTSELGILQRAIRSGGRGISIRNLFRQLPNLLPRMCPCMLMSPISAAQYLDPNREPFDIVVFDEASQLPTCKAIGVLARGRDAVIVGDPKQMPPTNFFSVNTVDEENLQEEDLESVLDDCLAINLPQTHLLWHYRSKHESLISFSNHQFYENKLFTFPSVDDRVSRVSLIHVDGVFERGKGRCNRAEAEVIVKEICRRYHDSELSKLSIGVITFNMSQQLLIDDMLIEACEKDPGLEKWINESEEPLFVKNLENVQGDERDVILFSIGYGPDANGKVYMNFGPLNRDGGWRRLNVAVSRARSEMIVFSTLTPDQINLAKTSAEGVAALKAFLSYASGEDVALDEHTSRQLEKVEDGIAKHICDSLKEKGFDAKPNIGNSEYKVDIGILDPSDPEKYILGILLDGNNYISAKTTRDRELAQIGILEALGWNIIRVWTMDWWDNPEKEISRIIKAINRLLSCGNNSTEEFSKEEPDEIEESYVECEETVQEKKDSYVKPYTIADIENQKLSSQELVSGDYDYVLIRTLEKVLHVESPIYMNNLFDRVLDSFGIEEKNSETGVYLEKRMEYLHPVITLDGEKKVCWDRRVNPNEYRNIRSKGMTERKPSDVPWVEAVNAMCYLLYSQVGMPKDELAQQTVILLGFETLIGEAENMVLNAFELIESRGLIKIDEFENCTLSEEGKKYTEKYDL